MTTQTTMEPLIPLWMLSAYDTIEKDSAEILREHDAEYREIDRQMIQLEDDYPFVRKLADGTGAMELSEDEHDIYNTYLSLWFDKESKERQYYYWMGHKHSLEYLRKLGCSAEQKG